MTLDEIRAAFAEAEQWAAVFKAKQAEIAVGTERFFGQGAYWSTEHVRRMRHSLQPGFRAVAAKPFASGKCVSTSDDYG